MSDVLKELSMSGVTKSTMATDLERANRLLAKVNTSMMQIHSEKSK